MHTIEVGPEVPRGHHAFLGWIGARVLHLLGWRLDIRLPNLPRFVVIMVPHTSNWDFVIGICAIFVIQVRVNWWAKHTIFRWPFRGILEAWGGIPINRGATRGAVPQIVEAIRTRPQFVFGLAPEGTRKRVEKWKTGFYQIAVAADLPIVPAYMDYRRKVCVTGPPIHPTGDYKADTARLLEYFRHVTPKYPADYAGTA